MSTRPPIDRSANKARSLERLEGRRKSFTNSSIPTTRRKSLKPLSLFWRGAREFQAFELYGQRSPGQRSRGEDQEIRHTAFNSGELAASGCDLRYSVGLIRGMAPQDRIPVHRQLVEQRSHTGLDLSFGGYVRSGAFRGFLSRGLRGGGVRPAVKCGHRGFNPISVVHTKMVQGGLFAGQNQDIEI